MISTIVWTVKTDLCVCATQVIQFWDCCVVVRGMCSPNCPFSVTVNSRPIPAYGSEHSGWYYLAYLAKQRGGKKNLIHLAAKTI